LILEKKICDNRRLNKKYFKLGVKRHCLKNEQVKKKISFCAKEVRRFLSIKKESCLEIIKKN
jgi:hypothetical protein